MALIARTARALRGYFQMHRTWHCAWTMAERY